MNTVPVVSTGEDRELWYVEQPAWRIPLYVDYFDTSEEVPKKLALVQPAIFGLMKPQIDELIEVIGKYASSISDDEIHKMWFVRSVFEGVAKKAPGITPKHYFEWQDKRHIGRLTEATAEFHEIPEQLPGQEKFIDFLASKYALLDKTQAKHFMSAVATVGVEWIGHYKKPIDFGLFKVLPLPFRANWKETIYAQEEQLSNTSKEPRPYRYGPKRFLKIIRGAAKTRDEWLAENRPDFLFDTCLLDVNETYHYIKWHLELVEGKSWREYVDKNEKEIRRGRGKIGYGRIIVRAIKKRKEQAIEAFVAWAKKIAAPCGAVESCNGQGGQGIVPLSKPYGATLVGPKAPVLPVVVDGEERLISPISVSKLEKAIENVRQVQNLLPEAPDMRELPSGDGAPVDGGVDRTSRVPVSDGNKNENPGGVVLDV